MILAIPHSLSSIIVSVILMTVFWSTLLLILGTIGEMLLSSIPEIAGSTAAACHSGSFEPSKVLLGLSLSKEEALGALRLSLGRGHY